MNRVHDARSMHEHASTGAGRRRQPNRAFVRQEAQPKQDSEARDKGLGALHNMVMKDMFEGDSLKSKGDSYFYLVAELFGEIFGTLWCVLAAICSWKLVAMLLFQLLLATFTLPHCASDECNVQISDSDAAPAVLARFVDATTQKAADAVHTLEQMSDVLHDKQQVEDVLRQMRTMKLLDQDALEGMVALNLQQATARYNKVDDAAVSNVDRAGAGSTDEQSESGAGTTGGLRTKQGRAQHMVKWLAVMPVRWRLFWFTNIMFAGLCMMMPGHFGRGRDHQPRQHARVGDAGPPYVGTATLKVPPVWSVERNGTYSLRAWLSDQGPIAALQITGCARELVRELAPNTLRDGLVDPQTGAHTPGIMVLAQTLVRQYAPLDEEAATKAVRELMHLVGQAAWGDDRLFPCQVRYIAASSNATWRFGAEC